MEDNVSCGSSSTCDDYYMVHGEPKLRVPDGGQEDVTSRMSEVLRDEGRGPTPTSDLVASSASCTTVTGAPAVKENPFNTGDEAAAADGDSGAKRAAGSPAGDPPAAESGQSARAVPPRSIPLAAPAPVVGPGPGPRAPPVFTTFPGLRYLGASAVHSCRSEEELRACIRHLLAGARDSPSAVRLVDLSIPQSPAHAVRLTDPTSGADLTAIPVSRIAYCTRGDEEAFAFSHSGGSVAGEPGALELYHCSAFQAASKEEVGRILLSFRQTFHNTPKSPLSSVVGVAGGADAEGLPCGANIKEVRLRMTLDVKEEDAKGGYQPVPKEKNNSFKLRRNIDKKVTLTVQQVSLDQPRLKIERCFGLLLGTGRYLNESDMTLLEMESMGTSSGGADLGSFASTDSARAMGLYIISGTWVPTDPGFHLLNTETPKDRRVYMSIAADLIIEGIQEPLRLPVECRAKIYPEDERFWIANRRPIIQEFVIRLTPTNGSGGQKTLYRIVQVQPVSLEVDVESGAGGLLGSLVRSASSSSGPSVGAVATPTDPEAPSDEDDEPLLSGTGIVSKEVTDEQLLESWGEVLCRWQGSLNGSEEAPRPKQVTTLVRKGIPETLRGEVWQLLTGCYTKEAEMCDAYRILISKDSQWDKVIKRDMHRTFTAHEFFKEAGGLGQDCLFRLVKAYAMYDEEVGYCQGFSFIAAALILHMPEEQAFCVLVKLMNNYRLRDMFRQNFEGLHLRFYQLDRLMQDHIPELWRHFAEMALDVHLYASQWFLTLFTAKFPLPLVYPILDLVFSEGLDVIFNVSIALLKASRKDLLTLDFEGAMKYFRVSMPKRYRTDTAGKELVRMASSLRISAGKLRKLERDYNEQQRQRAQEEDPVERLEQQVGALEAARLRLEQENDHLAAELSNCKLRLRAQLDQVEDKYETVRAELFNCKSQLGELEEEKARLESENQKLKEMCRRESEECQMSNSRQEKIISEYKDITSRLSRRLEAAEAAAAAGTAQAGRAAPSSSREDALEESNRLQLRELEQDLAAVKLELCELRCANEQLTHENRSLHSALEEKSRQGNWLTKTISMVRDKGGSGAGSASGGAT